jgi:hypothetical protein
MFLSTLAAPEKRKLAGTVRWTKAHRTERGDEDEEDRRDIRGNAAADAAAKEAVEDHPALGVDAESQLQFYERRIAHVVRAVVAALRLFPRAPGNMPRAPPPASRQQAAQRRRHFWQFKGGQWRCALCNDWTTARQLPRARRNQRCSGKTLYDEAGAMAKRGQSLCWADAEMPFTYCDKCGAWGHRRTHHLASACGPPKASGHQALRRIRMGQHPMQRRGPGGVLLPRERIATVAKYIAAEGAWKRMDGGRGERPRADESNGGPVPIAACARQPLTRATGTQDDSLQLALPDGVDDCAMHDVPTAIAEDDLRATFEEDVDVFGFGGLLDQPEEQRQQQEDGDGDSRQDEATATSGAPTVTSARSLARGAKSIYSGPRKGGAMDAIQRLMSGQKDDAN